MNLVDLMQEFTDEAKCRSYIEELRWPDGVVCPRCQSTKIYRLENRPLLLCASCEHQFSVTVGTIFHDTHLPLVKWFLATMLLCESKKGMSACQIQRSLGVSYKTAWYLCHRIRAAMHEANKAKLDGEVEVDETYVGGKLHGGTTGRGSENKEVVIGIRKRGGELRLFHAKDIKSGTLAKYIRENISQDVETIFTDDLSSYVPAIIKAKIHGSRHRTINHSKGMYVMGKVHTNTVESAFSLLKRGIMGTWHKISAKHLQAYLDEMSFRFDNRNNPYLFRDTILRLIVSPNLEYRELTKAS
jgi:transposase-like protein